MSVLSASVSITRSPSGASIASISALCATHVAPTSPFESDLFGIFHDDVFFRRELCTNGDGLQTLVQGIARRHTSDVMKSLF